MFADSFDAAGELSRFTRFQFFPPVAEERQKQREEKARPILLALFEYLEKEKIHVPQASKIFKAINYCLSHRNELINYLRDGNCSISNNLAERSIRPFTIGRKNWIFSGSPAGAASSAAALGLLFSCLLGHTIF